MPRRWRTILIRTVVAFGVLLRIAGAAINTQANDDHMEVIHVIASERRMPAPNEFWESFQPPLYHLSVAAALIALPPLARESEIKVAQAVSCAAGLFTLALLIWFIGRLSLSSRVSGVAIGLASLSPPLISTSIQATNDAFVILFVTLTLGAGYQFFRDFTPRPFAVMVVGAVLSCLSKGNGLVVALAVMLTFLAALWRPAVSRRRIGAFAATMFVVLAATVPVAGGYLARRVQMGSAFATNQEPSEPPALVRETFHKRPGITSIVGGFLTFRLVSMLDDPLIEPPSDDNRVVNYPRHRTSLWSLLYGGANSVHFAYYPETWRVPRVTAEWMVRTVELLALFPAAVLVMGLIRPALQACRQVVGIAASRASIGNLLLVLTALGYVAFVALYGYLYRDFATMKAIFAAPAALAFLAWFARDLDRPGGKVRGVWLETAFVSSVLLCVAYTADVALLIGWLRARMPAT